MSRPVVTSTRVRRTIEKSAGFAFACGALLWGACGETRKNSAADPATGSGAGGAESATSNTASSASAAMSTTAGGTPTTSAAAFGTSSAPGTTGQIEPGSGGASTTATTDQGAAGAEPGGAGGTGGTGEPDDGCEVESTGLSASSCQVTTTCPGFVQHTSCTQTSYAEHWRCDSSKPETSEAIRYWYNTVTGTADAAEACDAMVAVNLKRPAAKPINTADCSEYTSETAEALQRARLCGPRYALGSGVTVWDAQPASASCGASATGSGQSCSCEGLGVDDGDYELAADDLATALANVWEFCTNSSPAVPGELGECDSVANSSSGDGSCEFIDNCPLVLTDASGLELEEIVYREILCGPDGAAEGLACTCRVRSDRQFSFRASPGDPNVTACENLAQICDPRNSVERADGPAECEELSELFGRDSSHQIYSCSVPISMGGKTGRIHEPASLECSEADGGWLSCTCHDRFLDEKTTIEPATADLALAWEHAVSLCKARLEADPADL